MTASTISEHSMIGDLQTAALIDSKGHLAWLCWPDFDSEACFASLIGAHANGGWTLAPASFRSSSRRYLPNTLVLETTYVHRSKGITTVTDLMPIGSAHSTVVRIVRGIQGSVRMRTRFAPRFDYGNVQARLEHGEAGDWNAVAGPHRLTLRSDVLLSSRDGDLQADWQVKANETYSFVLQHSISYHATVPSSIDPQQAEDQTSPDGPGGLGRATTGAHIESRSSDP